MAPKQTDQLDLLRREARALVGFLVMNSGLSRTAIAKRMGLRRRDIVALEQDADDVTYVTLRRLALVCNQSHVLDGSIWLTLPREESDRLGIASSTPTSRTQRRRH